MNKYISIIPILLITGIGSAQSTTNNDVKISLNLSQSKDYGSPIKRWAGDAKCKLKRFLVAIATHKLANDSL